VSTKPKLARVLHYLTKLTNENINEQHFQNPGHHDAGSLWVAGDRRGDQRDDHFAAELQLSGPCRRWLSNLQFGRQWQKVSKLWQTLPAQKMSDAGMRCMPVGTGLRQGKKDLFQNRTEIDMRSAGAVALEKMLPTRSFQNENDHCTEDALVRVPELQLQMDGAGAGDRGIRDHAKRTYGGKARRAGIDRTRINAGKSNSASAAI
jgi:hypothetical protein